MTTSGDDPGTRDLLPFGGPFLGGDQPPLEEIGAKAFNLVRMANMGLPVPPGFVVPTGECRDFLARGATDLRSLGAALHVAVGRLEQQTGRRFGAIRKPLLLAVRSGSVASMPGMLETILDLGLNEDSVRGLVRLTGNPRMAWDCYRRFVTGFSEVAFGTRPTLFDEAAGEVLRARGLEGNDPVDAETAEAITRACIAAHRDSAGEKFPSDPYQQLEIAVAAVFRSWTSPKARDYRRLYGISDDVGTAVTVQQMVFGNAGSTSGSGVCFSRDPATGAPEAYIDFVLNGQGEDVVGGRHTVAGPRVLRDRMPRLHEEVLFVAAELEREFRDLQDFEFTVEDGKLHLLQTRAGKRSPLAALRLAADLVDEGVISSAEALRRLADVPLGEVTRTALVGADGEALLGTADAANVGVVTGVIALDARAARQARQDGQEPILVRDETATEDVAAMADAVGILTRLGSRTSHAAVVARQMGKVCLVGCGMLVIDPARRVARFGDRVLREGDAITLDGDGGRVFAGALAVEERVPEDLLRRVDAWKRGG